MFTVGLNDGQWLRTQILNAFTINQVGMCADVVVANGGVFCDVSGRIFWSTLSRYCGCIILECGMLAGTRDGCPVCAYTRRGRERRACGVHFITVSCERTGHGQLEVADSSLVHQGRFSKVDTTRVGPGGVHG